MCKLSSKLPVAPKIKPSPRDIIKREQIVWDYPNERIVINGIKGYVSIPQVADTNSMVGVFDYGHNPLLVADFDKNALGIGDIIIYVTQQGKIIHRIVKKGIDSLGAWYKCKGDNNFTEDPTLIRQENIMYLCIGIIY